MTYRGEVDDYRGIAAPIQIQRKDPGWPEILDSIPDPPPRLFVCGDLEVEQATLAIVGSRRATVWGRKTAFDIASSLAASGFRIISGLAYGIDASALEGALHGGGKPLAVLGNGLPGIYPASNRDLARRIVKAGGGLVSEYPPGTPPRKWHFPRRNRLISGWSLGVVLIEAAIRSGSMGTATHALEQGREVFVFPGSIEGGRNDGCHSLIQDGAHLVTCVDDIYQILIDSETPFESAVDVKILESLIMEHGSDLNRLLGLTGWTAIRLLKAWSRREF